MKSLLSEDFGLVFCFFYGWHHESLVLVFESEFMILTAMLL